MSSTKQKLEPIKVKMLGYSCIVQFAKYADGDRTAIELVVVDTDGTPIEPMARATVNLPGCPLAKNEVFIKNYSENEGIIDILHAAGVISKSIRQTPSGWVQVDVCTLLVNPDDY